MQIGQFTNSYVFVQLKLHNMKQKIAENHHSNQLLPSSNRYLEISNEMAIILAFQLFLHYLFQMLMNHHI